MRSEAFVMSLAAMLSAGCSPVLFTVHGVPNLRIVEQGRIYRGGEPTQEGWAYLRSLGVCATIQLDYDEERPTGSAPPAGIYVDKLEMKPSDFDDLFQGPDALQLQITVNHIIQQPCPVYLHCRWGRDRTGIAVAAYRHLFQKWTKQSAYTEAIKMGFHRELIGLVRAWEALP